MADTDTDTDLAAFNLMAILDEHFHDAGGITPIFRCRLCGALEPGTRCADGVKAMGRLVGVGEGSKDGGAAGKLRRIHRCDDGRMGLSDVVGFEWDKTPEPSDPCP